MSDSIVIKIILITSFLVMGVILFIPRKGDRPLALRRITLAVLLLAAIVGVAFPDLTTQVANVLGVGRGVDLLVYGLVVVFIYHSISSKSRFAQSDQRVTELARRLAIAEAENARMAGERQVAEASARGSDAAGGGTPGAGTPGGEPETGHEVSEAGR